MEDETFLTEDYLFKQFTFNSGDFSMSYYLYDPVARGANPESTYPLLTFFQDKPNAFNSELYASPTYQNKMGGAYILIPIANENSLDNVQSGWHEEQYVDEMKALIEKIYSENSRNIGKIFALGNSSDNSFICQMAKKYPKFFDELVPFDDGKSLWDKQPKGFTDWIKEAASK